MSARRSPGRLRDFLTSFRWFSPRVTSGSASLHCSRFSSPTCSFFPGLISVTFSRPPRLRCWSSLFWVTSIWVRGFRRCIGQASSSFVSVFSSLGILPRVPPRCAEYARSPAFVFRCRQRNGRRDLRHARHETRGRGDEFSSTSDCPRHSARIKGSLDVDRRRDDGAGFLFAVGRAFH